VSLIWQIYRSFQLYLTLVCSNRFGNVFDFAEEKWIKGAPFLPFPLSLLLARHWTCPKSTCALQSILALYSSKMVSYAHKMASSNLGLTYADTLAAQHFFQFSNVQTELAIVWGAGAYHAHFSCNVTSEDQVNLRLHKLTCSTTIHSRTLHHCLPRRGIRQSQHQW